MGLPATPLEDPRFSALLDDDLSELDRARLQRDSGSDAELEADFRAFEGVVSGLRALRPVEPPRGFLQAVQSRIRRRTRGGFYPILARARFPYEAVLNVILLGVLIAIYMTSMPAPLPEPTPVHPAAFDQVAPIGKSDGRRPDRGATPR